MNSIRLVTIVGNPSSGSRTSGLAWDVQGMVSRIAGVTPASWIELAEVCGQDFASVRETLREADVAVVASPTYKGTYSGLLKLLFDGVHSRDLVGCVGIPVMLVGGSLHAHACGSYLRPLLEEVGAVVPLPGLSVLEEQLGDAQSVTGAWWEASGWVYERLRHADDASNRSR